MYWIDVYNIGDFDITADSPKAVTEDQVKTASKMPAATSPPLRRDTEADVLLTKNKLGPGLAAASK